MSRLKLWTVAMLALAAAACGDSTTTPTPPETTPITDTYSSTLNQNGAVTHTFVTSQSGSVTARLTSLTPDSTILVGLSMGTWSGTQCQVVLTNDKAAVNSFIVGTTSASGNLCVRIYDTGGVVDPTTYEIQVTHF